MRVVAASDKFRGTATSAAVAGAVAAAARSLGWEATDVRMADGGEGTLDALGGPNRTTTVSGPLGDPVEAAWRLDGRRAVIETARASGLVLAGGPEGNDALAASTYGSGELLAAAIDAGARRIVVGVGGLATTDGGWGALRALWPLHRLRAVEVLVACDVRIRFVQAARRFAPQKGASPAQVELLERRLERLVQVYRDDYGVDVSDLEGSGAAGGLAGGLAAVGARLVPGFDLVADEVGLAEHVEAADLVVTGEGYLDDESLDGKVVGGVVEVAAALGTPALVVVGDADDDAVEAVARLGDVQVEVLARRFGEERSRSETLACVEQVVAERLAVTGG